MILTQYASWLVAMMILCLLSAFFSASEAALFYLRREDRLAFEQGTTSQQLAVWLLATPNRLLTAVLFCNLITNVAYFSLATLLALRLEADGHDTQAGFFSFGALLFIIFFSEMLPKSLAVLATKQVAALVAIPLSFAVRGVKLLLPTFAMANLLSRRVLFPSFRPEPYLDVADLERAVTLSTEDAELLDFEQAVLGNIVRFSELRVDELMRPRTRFVTFKPPVALADLGGRLPPSGYILITEAESDEVAAAVPLKQLSDIPDFHLERYAESVIYVPWAATAAAVLDQMRLTRHRVAAVINEYGETVGIVTFEDMLDAIFADDPSTSARSLHGRPLVGVAPGVWQVGGMTSLRRLARHFGVPRPETHAVTVAGLLQEELERMPEAGDQCRCGQFDFTVIDAPEHGQLLVELRLLSDEQPEEATP